MRVLIDGRCVQFGAVRRPADDHWIPALLARSIDVGVGFDAIAHPDLDMVLQNDRILRRIRGREEGALGKNRRQRQREQQEPHTKRPKLISRASPDRYR